MWHAGVSALEKEIPHAGSEFTQTSGGAKPASLAPPTAVISRADDVSLDGFQVKTDIRCYYGLQSVIRLLETPL